MLQKVRFETKDGHTHIFLDDQEIQGCVSASFDYDIAYIPTVRLELRAADVEIETDAADVCVISEESIETLGLSKITESILRNGIWYNKYGEEKSDPILTVKKLLEEYQAGRLLKYKGIGGVRYTAIVHALKERGILT